MEDNILRGRPEICAAGGSQRQRGIMYQDISAGEVRPAVSIESKMQATSSIFRSQSMREAQTMSRLIGSNLD
jgi:hypothetical protein